MVQLKTGGLRFFFTDPLRHDEQHEPSLIEMNAVDMEMTVPDLLLAVGSLVQQRINSPASSATPSLSLFGTAVSIGAVGTFIIASKLDKHILVSDHIGPSVRHVVEACGSTEFQLTWISTEAVVRDDVEGGEEIDSVDLEPNVNNNNNNNNDSKELIIKNQKYLDSANRSEPADFLHCFSLELPRRQLDKVLRLADFALIAATKTTEDMVCICKSDGCQYRANVGIIAQDEPAGKTPIRHLFKSYINNQNTGEDYISGRCYLNIYSNSLTAMLQCHQSLHDILTNGNDDKVAAAETENAGNGSSEDCEGLLEMFERQQLNGTEPKEFDDDAATDKKIFPDLFE